MGLKDQRSPDFGQSQLFKGLNAVTRFLTLSFSLSFGERKLLVVLLQVINLRKQTYAGSAGIPGLLQAHSYNSARTPDSSVLLNSIWFRAFVRYLHFFNWTFFLAKSETRKQFDQSLIQTQWLHVAGFWDPLEPVGTLGVLNSSLGIVAYGVRKNQALISVLRPAEASHEPLAFGVQPNTALWYIMLLESRERERERSVDHVLKQFERRRISRSYRSGRRSVFAEVAFQTEGHRLKKWRKDCQNFMNFIIWMDGNIRRELRVY